MALLRRSKVAQSDFFPGFTDVAEIGIGSLATVYRARETGTNRFVALKLLNVRDASPRAIESFERESIALGAVSSHPNIVTLFRSFRAGDGRPVLVLELCSGSIGDRMRNGQGLPVRDVVSIGIKIGGALETAHRAEILHRDVKPQNILMTEFGEPALADFGVAMLQSSTQTTAGLFDFTTLHAAPELLEGGETSAATDVYELASSIYQLIAGRSAFRAYDGESPASVILRILRDPVQPLVNALVPTKLSDLLLYAMSKEKADRPPTAAEFASELAAIEAEQLWPLTQFLIRDPNGAVAAQNAPPVPMLRPANAPPVGLATPMPRAAPPQSVSPPARPSPAPARAEPDWSTPTLSNRTPAAEPPADPIASFAPAPAIEARPWQPPRLLNDAPPPDPPRPMPPTTAPPTTMPPPQPLPALVDDATRRRPVPPAAPAPGRHSAAEETTRRPVRIDEDYDSASPPQAPPPQAPPPQAPSRPPAPPMPIGEETVRRSSLPQQYPRPAPTGQETVMRSSLPQQDPRPAPMPTGQETVMRSSLPGQYPIPPAGGPVAAGAGGAVPTWAARTPAQAPPSASATQSNSDLTLDPMSLRRRVTIRSGAAALVIDEQRLLLRSWWRRTEILWSDVLGFEPRFEGVSASGSGGHLIVVTRSGPVELPATKRSMADLRYVQALLDAYRQRARMMSGR